MPVIKEVKPFSKIAVALDFTDSDAKCLAYAASMALETQLSF